MVQSEEGATLALTLWTCAKAWGRTPWEVVHDPHLAYNLTVFNAALELKRIILARAGDGAAMSIAERILALE